MFKHIDAAFKGGPVSSVRTMLSGLILLPFVFMYQDGRCGLGRIQLAATLRRYPIETPGFKPEAEEQHDDYCCECWGATPGRKPAAEGQADV